MKIVEDSLRVVRNGIQYELDLNRLLSVLSILEGRIVEKDQAQSLLSKYGLINDEVFLTKVNQL